MVCGVSSTCMSMCLCPMEARRESPETGVTEHCKLLCGCQEVGPLELPLSTVPSLQTLAPHFWKQYHYLSIAGLKLNCVIALASNSQKSTSFCLLSAEIKSMYHHTWQQPHFVGGNTGSREKKKKSTQIQHNYVSCYSMAEQSYQSSHILWDPIKSLLLKFTLQDWLLPTNSHQKLPQRTRGHLRGPIIHH